MEVSAEVHFAQTLASNEKTLRDKALKKLKKYISVRSSHGEGLNHEDYIKIWKGLHYSMWMQDKPLLQEELSQKITELVHGFPTTQHALVFVNVFFITEAREWNGIDRLRLDKFMMLIRGILHETFVLLSREGWPVAECQSLAQHLTLSVMNEDNAKIPFGFKSHVADIFLKEMMKVSLAGLNAKKLTLLMLPFIYYLVRAKRRDLALGVFENTVKSALTVFGKWSWQGSSKHKKTKRKGMPLKKSRKAERSSDGEATDSGEESDDEQGSDAEESDDMDVDGDEEEEEDDDEPKKPRYKFDMSNVIRLLLQLAEDPKVQTRNRSMMLGFVRSYMAKDHIINRNTQSTEETQNPGEKFDEDDDSGDVDVSMVLQMFGSTEPSKKKRRRKKGGEERKHQLDIGEEKHTSMETEEAPRVEEITTISKSMKQGKDTKEVIGNNAQDQITSTAKNKRKKRKRTSSDGDGLTDSSVIKKLKIIDVDDETSPVVGKENRNEKPCLNVNKLTKKQKRLSQERGDVTSTTSTVTTDTNTNALSPVISNSKKKSKMSISSSPIEFTVYPQKSPKPSKSKMSVTPISASSSPPPASRSPKRRRSNVSVNSGESNVEAVVQSQTPSTHEKKKLMKERKSPSTDSVAPGGESEGKESSVGLMEGLYTAISTPCMMVKKVVDGIISPASTSKAQSAATPEPVLTPGSQKKVIFDLRRNKANKFKDYLKTLAQDPSPAFEPTKSPSQSILKTPPVSSILSFENTPTSKRKGKKKSPKTASPKLKVPKMVKSLSSGNIRKTPRL